MRTICLHFFLLCLGFVASQSVKEQFEKHRIVPDAIDVAPKHVVEVTFSDGKEADLGNEISPRETTVTPRIRYDADEEKFYTLLMIDADGPDGQSFEHWLVVNIPGSNISEGEVKADYVASGPALGDDFHRYVFLVFQQASEQVFAEERLFSNSIAGRPHFDVRQFSENHNLGNPVFGNFYLSKWDESVPELYKSLGL